MCASKFERCSCVHVLGMEKCIISNTTIYESIPDFVMLNPWRRLVSVNISISSCWKSFASSVASFCLPWFLSGVRNGLTGKNAMALWCCWVVSHTRMMMTTCIINTTTWHIGVIYFNTFHKFMMVFQASHTTPVGLTCYTAWIFSACILWFSWITQKSQKIVTKNS